MKLYVWDRAGYSERQAVVIASNRKAAEVLLKRKIDAQHDRRFIDPMDSYRIGRPVIYNLKIPRVFHNVS